MKLRSIAFVFPLAGLSLSAFAEDTKNYSYRTPAAQKADEIEDLGEITAADEGGAESDGKSTPVPEELKKKFRFNVSTRAEYTSNARLTGNHSSSDLLFLPTIEAGYNTSLGKYFTFDLATRIESGLFTEHGERAFWGYSAIATLDYRPRPNLPRVYVSAEPYRFDSLDTGDKITQAVGLSAGTDWGIGFNSGRSLVFAGYIYSHYFSDPSIDDRHTHRATIGLAHQLRQNLIGQLFYTFQYNDFTEISRRDSKHVLGANLVYQFSERLFGTLTSNFIDNDSNSEFASYQAVTAGVGLTLQF
ncbi:MAG TPA: outer membrane beta-barrel protein [Chthoniobacteraceae bacterium]|jgi:hypothetical protein|nr:hypothetical protein [Chthoniobacter sp.]HEV7866958.1 outer membrane beta-barrel protein [Chthoniobacteraceae bacterium]